MMRRVRSLVFVLALFAPVIASAAHPQTDPDGLPVTGPEVIDWLDSIGRVLIVYLGI